MAPPHFLLVTFPARGHVNPSLRFARRLIKTTGARVTFATSLSVFRCSMIPNQDNVYNLSFLTFSDGFDDGVVFNTEDVQNRLLNIKRYGEKTLSNLPGYNHSTINNNSGFEFPNLPALTIRDLPSFLSPSNKNKATQAVYLELMEFLKEESNPKILVNTFDSLEPEALNAIPNIKLVAIGPLLPEEIFRERESVKDLPRDDQSSYTLWLDSKTESSVIYVSFGTMVELPKKQIEELARALIEGRRPFLWVITNKSNREAKIEGEEETEVEKIDGFRHELEEVGMIVSWCSQVEVLRHRAVSCFVTHCGWSSTLESLVLGIPVVAFPMWSDQPTNAKLLEETWKTGVRVRENEEGLVETGEIRKCLEAVMGEKAQELRQNTEKWKRLAFEAGGEGGSSDKNMDAFVETVLRLSET